jgi:hypothetical protein
LGFSGAINACRGPHTAATPKAFDVVRDSDSGTVMLVSSTASEAMDTAAFSDLTLVVTTGGCLGLSRSDGAENAFYAVVWPHTTTFGPRAHSGPA